MVKHYLRGTRKMTHSAGRKTVLIATDNMHEAGYISEALRVQGYHTLFSEFDGKTLKKTPVKTPDAILFVFSDFVEKTPLIVKAIKKHYAPKAPPIIGALGRGEDLDISSFDSVIFPPAHITQIANRVSSMIRLGQMEREINRRIATLKEDFDTDHTLSEESLTPPFRILFIGKATPDFMVIINALQKKNVEVVAAFTSFSAFDFLHESRFDAVVMNALKQSEPALTISETMRRNASLYHVPTLFLVNSETFTDHELAYRKGARDIISTDAPTQEISGRILELANYHRIHNQLKDEFSSIDSTCLDNTSQVFTDVFFRAHLNRVSENMKFNQLPLTLIAIRAFPTAHFKVSDHKISEAMAQIGQMVKTLVRMQDITARLADDIYIIAFPEQDIKEVEVVIERIKAIVDCTAFESCNEEDGAFSISLQTAIITQIGHETGDELISHALSELSDDQRQLQTG